MGLLPLRGNTPSGSVAPSWPPSPPSNRCGSPNKSMMNAVHPLFTGNASKQFLLLLSHHNVETGPILHQHGFKDIPTDVLIYIILTYFSKLEILSNYFVPHILAVGFPQFL